MTLLTEIWSPPLHYFSSIWSTVKQVIMITISEKQTLHFWRKKIVFCDLNKLGQLLRGTSEEKTELSWFQSYYAGRRSVVDSEGGTASQRASFQHDSPQTSSKAGVVITSFRQSQRRWAFWIFSLCSLFWWGSFVLINGCILHPPVNAVHYSVSKRSRAH